MTSVLITKAESISFFASKKEDFMITSLALIFLVGLPCGNMVLSVAVLSIIITAPLGAWAMDIGKNRLLNRE